MSLSNKCVVLNNENLYEKSYKCQKREKMAIYKCKMCDVNIPAEEYIAYSGICIPCYGDGNGDELEPIKAEVLTFSDGRKYMILRGHNSIKYQLAIEMTEEPYRMAVIGTNSEGKSWEESNVDVLAEFGVFRDKTTQTK